MREYRIVKRACPRCGDNRRLRVGGGCMGCEADAAAAGDRYYGKVAARLRSLPAGLPGAVTASSYADARAAGLPWYPGRCKACGGVVWRWIDDTKCISCWRAKRGV